MPRGWSPGIWSLHERLGGQASSATRKTKSTDMVESDWRYRSCVTRAARKVRKIGIPYRHWIVIVQFQKISILPTQKGLEFPGGRGFCKAEKFKEMFEA